MKVSLFHEISSYLPATTSFVNLFGQSECQCICTYKVDDPNHALFDSSVVPIGYGLPGCRIALFDEHEQEITAIDTIGELYVASKQKINTRMNIMKQ